MKYKDMSTRKLKREFKKSIRWVFWWDTKEDAIARNNLRDEKSRVVAIKAELVRREVWLP